MTTLTPAQAARLSVYAESFPMLARGDEHWSDRVVTQGHADYCQVYGHTTHATIPGVCPRCGDRLQESTTIEVGDEVLVLDTEAEVVGGGTILDIDSLSVTVAQRYTHRHNGVIVESGETPVRYSLANHLFHAQA